MVLDPRPPVDGKGPVWLVRGEHLGARFEPRSLRTKMARGARFQPTKPGLAMYWADGIPWTLDVHINNPLSATHFDSEDCTARSAKAKQAKYKSMVSDAGHDFKTFGVEVLGGWSQSALSWLKKLCSTYPEADRHDIAGEIAVEIQRGNARILLATMARDK